MTELRVDFLHDPDVELVRLPKVPKSKIKLISAADIQKMEIAPIRWIIKDLIPEGLIILAGRPKVGKSWLALNMALAVANGKPALGKFESEKSRVLYVALEDNYRRIKDRLNNILNCEIDKTAPANLKFVDQNNDLPMLNNGGVEELQKIIDDDQEIKLIIIDTLGRAIADKARNDRDIYRADYNMFAAIQKLAMKNNICVLLLHHTKKAQEDDVFNEISGTSGITGAMDTMLVLKKKNDQAKLHIRGRDIKDDEYKVHFDENIFCWNVVEEGNNNMTPERKEIYELIKSSGREMKTGEIAELLGKTVPNVSKMLGKMLKEKLVATKKTGFYFIPEERKEKGFTVKKMSLFKEHKDGENG